MKSIKNIFIVGIIILMILPSCTKNNSNNTIENEIKSHVQIGSWRITKFIDSGTDETSDFNGYNFTFNTDGVLTATNSSNTYTGTWSISDNNSNDDSKDDLDFNIYFALTNEFEDLNDDWDIESHSSSEIKLYDISGGSGDIDSLTLVKN